ncbi:MAG: hypothetical protein KDD44_13870, partial [Bdellovibrionales bacterium]|nr:hypothetical protein [Bdellovibrionales bacterium]
MINALEFAGSMALAAALVLLLMIELRRRAQDLRGLHVAIRSLMKDEPPPAGSLSEHRLIQAIWRNAVGLDLRTRGYRRAQCNYQEALKLGASLVEDGDSYEKLCFRLIEGLERMMGEDFLAAAVITRES